MIKIKDEQIDFDVDEFMAHLGVDKPLGHLIQPMDTNECPSQLYEGIANCGASVNITIRGLQILVDLTFGSFPVQSLEEELFVRTHFEKVLETQSLFFISGNGHLIISYNQSMSILEVEKAQAVIQETIDAVPRISALLAQHNNFIPFACKKAEERK